MTRNFGTPGVVLTRAVFKLAVFFIAAASHAQTPKFEVASIRPCASPQPAAKSSPGNLRLGCQSLLVHIIGAYVVFADGRRASPSALSIPVEGGPAWVRNEMFTIDARAEGDPGVALMSGPMLQDLLEERFRLKLHRETREVPVYALTAAKARPKFTPFVKDDCSPSLGAPPEGLRRCRATIQPALPNMVVDAEGLTMEEFAKSFLSFLDRPVIDRTSITGRFDFLLRFTPDDTTPGIRGLWDRQRARQQTPDDLPPGPSIFSAIQEQLGLKLEATRGPRDFLVIDQAERPSAN